MAWTSSARQQGVFALAAGAVVDGETGSEPQGDRVGIASTLARRPLALATLAHLSGLGIIAPIAQTDPIVAVPVLIGLVVSYITLTRAERTMPEEAPEHDEAVTSNEVAISSRAEFTDVPRIEPTLINPDLRADLMARVSHELRTPLNAVLGFSDLMGHQMFGPLGHPRYEEYVSHIRESSLKLLKSAEDTLAITSMMAKSASRDERETLALSTLVNESRAAMAVEVDRRGLSYVVDIPTDIEVVAHRRALRQALVNVICEAVAHAADGATLTLTASLDIDKVAFITVVDKAAPVPTEKHRSLPICLARTLLELDGCQLIEEPMPSAPWSVLLSLDAATQQDFFC